MFKKIIHSWKLARADVLRNEFSELLSAWNQLLQSDKEESRFIEVSIKICFDQFGKKDEILSLSDKAKKSIVKDVEKWMKKAPFGNAIGYAWFAKWLESSYLPGDNAKVVYATADDVLFNIYKF